MAITQMSINNFKGIGTKQNIEIRPLTVFIGANSSGKSSCIHALTVLSQSVKLSNNDKAVIFDDEYAFIHLGRFIDVIHSKKYSDSIQLGFSVEKCDIDAPLIDKNGEKTFCCEFQIKTNKRTQVTQIEKTVISIGDLEVIIVAKENKYFAKSNKSKGELVYDYFGLNRGILLSDIKKEDIDLFLTIGNMMNVITGELTKAIYLGPFRQPPKRYYQTFSSAPSEVGSMGEATVSLLANEIIQSHTREHITQVSNWLKVLQLGQSLEVSRLTKSDLFQIRFDTDSKFEIADLGYGMSQVLPVLTQCSYAPEQSTLLFEQPEIHLHPLASRGLAKVFVETIESKKCNIIIETHSEDLIVAIQRSIGELLIKKEDVIVYKAVREEGETHLSAIDINDDGEIYDNWKKGFSSNI
jgi:predicted ATPase